MAQVSGSCALSSTPSRCFATRGGASPAPLRRFQEGLASPFKASPPPRSPALVASRRRSVTVACTPRGGSAFGKHNRDQWKAGQKLAASFADFVRESRARGLDHSSLEISEGDWWRTLDTLYVLLFNSGSDNEGIYCLQLDDPDSVPQNVILAFETAEDAERFLGLLEAELAMVPSVQSITPEHLDAFCQESAYTCQVARQGELVFPPEQTVEMTDWERATRLRQGQYEVLSQEVEPALRGNIGSGDGNEVETGVPIAAGLSMDFAFMSLAKWQLERIWMNM